MPMLKHRHFFFASIYNESLFLQWLSLNCDSFQTVALFKLWLFLNYGSFQTVALFKL